MHNFWSYTQFLNICLKLCPSIHFVRKCIFRISKHLKQIMTDFLKNILIFPIFYKKWNLSNICTKIAIVKIIFGEPKISYAKYHWVHNIWQISEPSSVLCSWDIIIPTYALPFVFFINFWKNRIVMTFSGHNSKYYIKGYCTAM